MLVLLTPYPSHCSFTSRSSSLYPFTFFLFLLLFFKSQLSFLPPFHALNFLSSFPFMPKLSFLLPFHDLNYLSSFLPAINTFHFPFSLFHCVCWFPCWRTRGVGRPGTGRSWSYSSLSRTPSPKQYLR